MTTAHPPPAGPATDADVDRDLVERLLAHCGLMCVTGSEGPIADAVAAHHRGRGDRVQRIGHSLVISPPGFAPPDRARADGDGARSPSTRPLVLLVGHLDVVAPTDADATPVRVVRDDVDVVVGRGTSDMKAGNVVAMRTFERIADGVVDSAADVVVVLYGGEEGPAEGNELARVLDEVGWLATADLAIILEPTDGEVQLGCLGGLHATLAVHGAQAHSARPWHGRNALTAAGTLLSAFDSLEPLEVEVGGVVYRDVWSVTQLSTPNGRNVIPGRVDINLNFRFSPTRGLAEAEAELHDLVAGMAEVLELDVDVAVTDRAAPAPPGVDQPLVGQFLTLVDAPVAAKQAWTDVARFAQVGVPAVNFGPGRTDQAHQRGEFVEVWRLAAAATALEHFLSHVAPGAS